jgi:hypothetical protein
MHHHIHVRSADAEQALEILEQGADGNGQAAELTESGD